MKRLNVRVPVLLAALLLVVGVVWGFGRGAVLAHRFDASPSAVAMCMEARVIGPAAFAFKPLDACSDACCGGSGDCGGGQPCGGHGACGSGLIVAPETSAFLAPTPSGHRVTARAVVVLTGVSRSPDDPPPRVV